MISFHLPCLGVDACVTKIGSESQEESTNRFTTHPASPGIYSQLNTFRKLNLGLDVYTARMACFLISSKLWSRKVSLSEPYLSRKWCYDRSNGYLHPVDHTNSCSFTINHWVDHACIRIGSSSNLTGPFNKVCAPAKSTIT